MNHIFKRRRLETLEHRHCLAGVEFVAHEIFHGGGSLNARAAAVGDFDGDGDEDIFSAAGHGALAFYQNTDGKGPFQLVGQVADSFFGIAHLTSGDLDGDGDLDVVAGGNASGQIKWHENLDGRGTFAPAKIVSETPHRNISYLFVGDMDGDNDADLTVAYGGTDKFVIIYENIDGAGNFGKAKYVQREFTHIDWPGTAVSDFDGDGDLDIMSSFANYGRYDVSNTIVWYENIDGVANFSEAKHVEAIVTRSAVPVVVNALDAADFDDGDIDVVAAAGKNAVAWYENTDSQGDFAARERVVIDNQFSDVDSVAATDFDGDGFPDIVASSSNSAVWYRNDGTGKFVRQTLVAMKENNRRFVLRDINGDQLPDIVTTDTGIVWYGNWTRTGVPARMAINELTTAESVKSGDFDGDGDFDIVVGGRSTMWFENMDGQGLFGPPVVPTRSLQRELRVADVDNDGDLDIVAGGLKLVWFENIDGLGNFVERIILDDSYIWIDVADVNGDGYVDILSEPRKIVWFENRNGEMFSNPKVIEDDPSLHLNGVFVADFDKDGDMDVFTVNNNKLEWYENQDGNGGFSVCKTTVATGLFSAAISDVDADGDTDILTAGDRQLIWYENERVNGFQRRRISNGMTSNTSIVSVDMDNDDDLDIFFWSPNVGIAWHENRQGEDRFGPQLQIGSFVGSGISSIDAQDLDGDGDTDLMTASLLDGRVVWYENVGIPGDAKWGRRV